MKKLIITLATLSTVLLMAQTENKKDSIGSKDIKAVNLVKRSFERKSDRMVYNIANSPISKGSNGFEVLKQTPMITVTDDKTLKILGKAGTKIYINGKESKMDADAIVEMLKTMPSENIQKIEIITTPSSEFQVEGNQGIINIVLKKKPTDGTNGNIKIVDKQGFYNSPSATGSVNYRKGKLGISTNLNAGLQNRIQGYELSNGNYSGDNPYKVSSVGSIKTPDFILGGYVNVDYDINDKQSVGFSYNYRKRTAKNSAFNFYNEVLNLRNQEITQRSETQTGSDMTNFNQSYNLNYDLKTDDKGSKFSIATSYLYYTKTETNINTTYLLDEQKNSTGILGKFYQNSPLKVNNFGAQIDYIQKLKSDYTLSFGANYNDTTTNAEAYFENLIPPTGKDENQSNHFTYHEKITGVYLTCEKSFSEKLSTKLGVRFDHTYALGQVVDKNIEIERDNSYWLPYLNINYLPSENHNLTYSFSSRILRPSFWQLNPVKIYLTSTNYVQNNPFAKAERTYTQELNYMYKSAYFINASYTLTNDASEQIPLTGTVNATQEKVLAYIRTNYGTKQEYSLSFGLQKQFFKGIWNVNNVLILGHNQYKGEVDGDPTDANNLVSFQKKSIDYSANYFQLQLVNNIRLSSKKDWYLGVNYFYLSPLQLEVGRLLPMQSLDVSLKKLVNNWTFTLNIQDVFNTSKNRIEGIDSNGNFNNVYQNNYNRSVSFGVTYSFGNQKLQKMKKSETANEDIRNRTNG